MGNRNKKQKSVEKFKTRKELRKDKRLQKKANRVHFQKRKKELKMEFKERLKQMNVGKKGKSNEKVTPKIQKYSNESRDNDEEMSEYYQGNDDDEEIESDFELSDEELEIKTKSISKQNQSMQKPATQLEIDQQRLKKQEQSLRKDMGKQRIKQLKIANEDEDKTIHKLEKLLKIDKSKNKKGIPRMFNDGLDYALEMCLPENIEKMYAAAKEAADADQYSDTEWNEDFALATGENEIKTIENSITERKGESNIKFKESTQSMSNEIKKAAEKKRAARLREIEMKFFGSSDDELASDLSEVDSEFEMNEEIDQESSNDDEAPDEITTVSKSSKKRQAEIQCKNMINDEEDGSEFDESESEGMSDHSDIETTKNVPKMSMNVTELDECSNDRYDDSEKPNVWEDIYGRKRDKDGKIIVEQVIDNGGKYIPPHQRVQLGAQNSSRTADGKMDPIRNEKLVRLKRLIKGQLNRLSETNMHKISVELDNLYMQNSRHDMNTTLTTSICDALISHVLAPERMVMEHALLIAALHANVGTEVGANLLETLVDRFRELTENGIEQYDVEDKTLDNILFLMCHMYTFKIFHHRLIYELLNKLIDKFCEKSVECVLLILRSVGFALRKDDPAALKEIIIVIQKKASDASDEFKSNARLKYMLDVLMAIRNNNVNRLPNYDPELATHLRKILKNLCVNGKYVTTLNISLEDLLNVHNRGKWWVVGSAWSGNVNDMATAVEAHSSKKDEQKYSEQLLELARKQRMNTDERRNVFCILMSAEDYIDAFEKILHLAIKDHRIAVSVIIHCCLSEKSFNPYYAVLAQKFCDYDRKYQLAVQYAVWDRIKDIQSHEKSQLTNLAQFLVHLISNASLALSVLKVIEFGEIDKTTLRLVRQILLGVLLGKADVCKEIFQRIAPSTQLKPFKDSIRLFMHHFLLKGGAKNGIPDSKIQLLKERIKIADRSLDTTTIRF